MTKEEWEASIAWTTVVVGCVIYQDGKYLMVQEKQAKAYGLWNLPAGYVDKGEELEHAAVREAKEETGFDVELIGEIDIYHDKTTANVRHAYRAKIVGGELLAQPEEILQVKWLTYAEIKALNDDGKIRAPWIWDVITKIDKTS